MGVEVVKLNCTPDGEFAHNPEPLKDNLTEISRVVVDQTLIALRLFVRRGDVR